jgi:hypothetical protein
MMGEEITNTSNSKIFCDANAHNPTTPATLKLSVKQRLIFSKDKFEDLRCV